MKTTTQKLTPNIPTPEGREAGAIIARFADEAAARFPAMQARCATCAFRRGTYPNECGATVLNALKCAIEGEAFECHEHVGRPCAGWAALRASSDKLPRVAPWPYIDGAADAVGPANSNPFEPLADRRQK